MNPFNIPAKMYISMYADADGVVYKVMSLFSIFVSALMVWLVAAIFIPGISYAEHITMLINVLFLDPVWAIFHFFTAGADIMHANLEAATEPASQFAWLIMWLACIGLSLIVWPALVFVWVAGFALGYVNLLSGETKEMVMTIVGDMKHTSVEAANIRHLVMGRTSYNEVYDADVKANAIVEALKKEK